jgi:hypothetical protein
MRIYVAFLIPVVLCVTSAVAKTHVVAFGKWTTIKWAAGPEEDKMVEAKVRAIYVDGQLKEFSVGSAHEITDRLFAVRRAVRVNDTLPQESGPSRWVWQPAAWLMIDRVTAHITQIGLTDFDPYMSLASWYRDYIAYCGISDDGKKLEAVVAQAGRWKPVLKKKIGEPANDGEPLCAAPDWQRQPMRVSFEQKSGDKLTYSVRGRAAETIKEEEEDDSD